MFACGDVTCAAVIEVKTTREHVLRLKSSYLSRLRAYAELVAKLLLVAWRPRDVGWWILVDPRGIPSKRAGVLELEFEVAAGNDLMGILAGDYFVVPEEGAGLVLNARRVGEKQPTAGGYEATFEVEDAHGERMSDVPDSIAWTLLANAVERQEVTDQGFTQSFLASGQLMRAQEILRAAARFRLAINERVNWKAVGKDLNVGVNSDDLARELGKHFGSAIRYVLHLVPQTKPSFLPEGWRRGAKP